jgi:hypothetical protein
MFSEVHISYSSDKTLLKMEVSGHAGVKEVGRGYEVCIALSALTQGLYKSLSKVIGKKYLSYKRKSGYLLLEFNIQKVNKLSEEDIKNYKIITNAYLIAIKDLSYEYQNFIKYVEGN